MLDLEPVLVPMNDSVKDDSDGGKVECRTDDTI
jgi:hypothetical protein